MSFDYCFIGDKGDIVTQIEADEEPGSIKVLVVRDNRSKAVFAHTVPVKGADEGGFAVKAIVDDVVWLGYTKLVLKTVNELAILKKFARVVEGLEDCRTGSSDARELARVRSTVQWQRRGWSEIV